MTADELAAAMAAGHTPYRLCQDPACPHAYAYRWDQAKHWHWQPRPDWERFGLVDREDT